MISIFEPVCQAVHRAGGRVHRGASPAEGWLAGSLNQLVDDFDLDDCRYTSAFSCRLTTSGTGLSPLSFGGAVDRIR